MNWKLDCCPFLTSLRYATLGRHPSTRSGRQPLQSKTRRGEEVYTRPLSQPAMKEPSLGRTTRTLCGWTIPWLTSFTWDVTAITGRKIKANRTARGALLASCFRMHWAMSQAGIPLLKLLKPFRWHASPLRYNARQAGPLCWQCIFYTTMIVSKLNCGALRSLLFQ